MHASRSLCCASHKAMMNHAALATSTLILGCKARPPYRSHRMESVTECNLTCEVSDDPLICRHRERWTTLQSCSERCSSNGVQQATSWAWDPGPEQLQNLMVQGQAQMSRLELHPLSFIRCTLPWSQLHPSTAKGRSSTDVAERRRIMHE